MEPSRDLASTGEFNGSESGWTTYIGSRIYSEIYIHDEQSVHMEDYNYKNAHEKVVVDDDDDDHVDDKAENNNKGAGDEESDDDSMASDASSGPSYFQLVCINNEGTQGSNGLVYKKHTENDHHEKILSAKRASKQVKKTRYEYKVEKEEEDSLLLIADSAASHV